ncbi:E3 ubiquitin-protein ligase ATL31-like [Wolffia australiana]
MTTAVQTRRRRHGLPALSFFFFFFIASLLGFARGQNPTFGPPANPYDAWRGSFNPAMAVIVVILLVTFFFTAFFSIYIRSRRERAEMERMIAAAGLARAAAPRGGPAVGGLSEEAIDALPSFVYSQVKEHKLGKGALECAVCLSEFEDEDTLRLLPKCDHVFHSGCIDAWLAAHKTCPVCRTNLEAVAAPPQEVAITVEAEEEVSAVPPPRRWFPRSNTTGHSVEERERYRLRLPETVREEVMAGRFRRAASCVASGAAERSSFKMRTKDRWASFKRSFSLKISRGDGASTSAGASDGVGLSSFKMKALPKGGSSGESAGH